jgi:hypothetical protein
MRSEAGYRKFVTRQEIADSQRWQGCPEYACPLG